MRQQEEERRIREKYLSGKKKLTPAEKKELDSLYLSEAEKLDRDYKLYFFKKMMEYDTEDDIKFKGEILSYSPQVEFVLKYRGLFEELDKKEMFIRDKAGFLAEKVTYYASIPVIKMIENLQELCESKLSLNILNLSFDMVENLDKQVGNYFRNP